MHRISGIIVALCLLSLAQTAQAAVKYSRASAGWSTASTWSTAGCGGAANTTAPVAADDVTICTGHAITTSANSSALSLVIQTGGTLTQATNRTLTIGAGGLSVAGTLTSQNTLTVNGTTSISGALNITSTTGGKTFTGAVTINPGGTWSNTANEAVSMGGDLANSGTFTSGTSTYTFTGPTQWTGSDMTFAGPVVANNNLTVNVSGTVALANSITVTGTTSVTGTLGITSTTGTKTFTGDVTINSGGIWNETVAEAVTFGGNLQNDGTLTASTGVHTFTGTAKTFSGANAIIIPSTTISGTYQNNDTLTVSTTLAGTGTLTNGATGTLNIGAASVTPTLVATAAGNIVNYNRANIQTVKPTDYHHLSLGGTSAKTMTGVTVIGGDLNVSDSATMTSNAAFAVTGALNYFSTGTTTLTAATPISIGTFNQTAGTLAAGANTITVTGTGAGTWTKTGTFTTTGTVIFTGNAPGIGASNFNNLTISLTGVSPVATLEGNATVAGNLSVTAGTLDLAAFTANRTVAGGTLTVADNATLKIGGTNGFPTNYTTHTLGAASTVEYSGTDQSVGAETAPGYGNLTISGSGSGTKSMAGSFTVRGTLTLTAGTFAVGANTLTLNGPAIAGAGAATSLSTTSGTSLSFGGTSTGVFVPGSVAALNNLTINNASGVDLNSSPTIAGTLTLTNGVLSTGSNTVNVTGSNCPGSYNWLVGGGYVNGNLRLKFPSGGATCTFHIGSGSVYAPITLTTPPASTGGTLTARTTGSEHPNIATSGIDATKDANRYWTLWASGDTISTPSYDATFNFIAGDVDALATSTLFVLGKYAGSAWTLPAPVTAAATSVAVTGISGPISSPTDFAVGEVVFVCNVPSDLPANMTCECDNFNRASVNPSTIFGGNYTLTQSSGTPGWPKIANGHLQMTDNSGNMATSATVPGTFPAAGNLISVEFRHYAYKTGGAAGADGIAVTLSDSIITPLAGAFGGSLGYAQKTIAGGAPVDVSGFAGGWVGIGIDEWGNFSAATEGRVDGIGQTAQSVAVRGSGANLIGYPYLGGTVALSPVIDNTSSATPAPGHAYRVQVDARCYQNNTANYTGNFPVNCATANPSAAKWAKVRIYRDTSGTGSFGSPLTGLDFEAYAAAAAVLKIQADLPATWKLSYTGSTGGSTNFHEIGALKICAQTITPPAGYRIQVDNLTPSTCGTPGGTPSSPIVTVTALDTNGNPVTTYDKTVTLSAPLSGGGASSAVWSLKTGTGTFTPPNQYKFEATDLGVAQFYLTDASPQSVTVTVSENGGTISSSLAPPPIVYSGGSFTIANIDTLGAGVGGGVVAGRAHLMSVTRSNGCVTDTTYTGAKNLDGWYTPSTGDHPVGALAPQLCATNGSGTCLSTTGACQELSIAVPSVDPSNLMPTLTFASGIAYFCIATSDVGKYSVSLRDDSATPVSGSSGTLTVRPFAVVVSDIKQGATNNPANDTSGGSIFAKAGTAFQSTVGGYLWNSAGDTGSNGLPGAAANWAEITAAGIAPSYADTVTLAAGAPFTPATGILSNGSVAVTAGSATATTLSYNEVGSFTLTAAPATSYLNSGINLSNRVAIFSKTGDNSPNQLVGRFIPHHFDLSGGAIVNRSDMGSGAGCSPIASTFTYMDEPMKASFTLTAKNAAGNTTNNYAGSYAKFTNSAASWTTYDIDDSIGLWMVGSNYSQPGSTNCKVLFDSATPSSTTFASCTGATPPPVTLTAGPRVAVTSPAALSWLIGAATFSATTVLKRADAPDGPYDTLDIGVAPRDSEGVTLQSAVFDLDVDNSGGSERKSLGTTKARFGRLRLSNAFGSERQNLPVTISAMYYAGSPAGWAVNTVDGCTALPTAPFTPFGTNTTANACYTAACTSNSDGGVNSVWLHDVGGTLIAGAAAPNAASALTLGTGTGTVTLTAPLLLGTPTPGTLEFTLVAPPWLQTNSGTLTGAPCTSAVFGCNPMGRVTFGVYGPKTNKSKFIYMRESY